MLSINTHRIRQRISGIYDTLHASQGTEKSVKGYVKSLRKSVEIKEEGMGDANAFKRDFGGGI